MLSLPLSAEVQFAFWDLNLLLMEQHGLSVLSLQTEDLELISVLTIFPPNIFASLLSVWLGNKPTCALRLFCLPQCCIFTQPSFLFNGKTPPLFNLFKLLGTNILFSLCLFWYSKQFGGVSTDLEGLCDLWGLNKSSVFKDNAFRYTSAAALNLVSSEQLHIPAAADGLITLSGGEILWFWALGESWSL